MSEPIASRSGFSLLPLLGMGPAFLALNLLVYPTFVPDDLYIYLQFVRNLLETGMPAFNAGEPTYGFTSVLWLGVLTVVGGVSGELETASRIASSVVALAALAGMATLVFDLSGSRAAAWAAAGLLGLDTWFLRWASTGMESSLAVALLLWGFRRRGVEARRGLGPLGSTVCFASLALVRPEAFLLVALSILDAWLPVPGATRRLDFRRAWVAGAAAAGILVPWMTYAVLRFGTLLPDTAPAKGVPGAALQRAVESLVRVAGLSGVTVGVPVLLLFLASLHFWRSGGGPALGGALLRHRLLAAWLVALPLMYAATGVKVYSRYLLLATPLWLAVGLAVGWSRFQGRLRPLWAGAVLATMIGNGVLTVGWVAPASRDYGESFRRVNVGLGRWLAEHTPTDTVVGAENIGAIAFFSRRRILDMNGLVSPEIIPYKRAGRVEEYLEAHPPDYLIKIDSRPDPWSDGAIGLELEAIRSLPYEHMFIDQEAPLYYTLYRVLDRGDGGGVVR